MMKSVKIRNIVEFELKDGSNIEKSFKEVGKFAEKYECDCHLIIGDYVIEHDNTDMYEECIDRLNLKY